MQHGNRYDAPASSPEKANLLMTAANGRAAKISFILLSSKQFSPRKRVLSDICSQEYSQHFDKVSFLSRHYANTQSRSVNHNAHKIRKYMKSISKRNCQLNQNLHLLQKKSLQCKCGNDNHKTAAVTLFKHRNLFSSVNSC